MSSQGRRAVWPVAVTARRGTARRRPLVVLPTITWQGENPFDDDLDGFADTLENAPAVGLARPFARGRRPAGLRRATPLLGVLDRERLPYDITTDHALAGRRGPALEGAPGVAFAGSARWLTPDLERRLRRYVERGGRLASFGRGAFRRRVRIRRGRLVGTSGASPTPLAATRRLGRGRVISAGSSPAAEAVARTWRELR